MYSSVMLGYLSDTVSNDITPRVLIVLLWRNINYFSKKKEILSVQKELAASNNTLYEYIVIIAFYILKTICLYFHTLLVHSFDKCSITVIVIIYQCYYFKVLADTRSSNLLQNSLQTWPPPRGLPWLLWVSYPPWLYCSLSSQLESVLQRVSNFFLFPQLVE